MLLFLTENKSLCMFQDDKLKEHLAKYGVYLFTY